MPRQSNTIPGLSKVEAYVPDESTIWEAGGRIYQQTKVRIVQMVHVYVDDPQWPVTSSGVCPLEVVERWNKKSFFKWKCGVEVTDL